MSRATPCRALVPTGCKQERSIEIAHRDKKADLLRDVHFCKTCDFRLPFCVRTDREFCGKRCRVWWYRHPGVKRLDFSPGEDIPSRRRRGQPKTLAEALMLLALERTRADELRRRRSKRRRAKESCGISLRRCVMSCPRNARRIATLRDELEDDVRPESARRCAGRFG
jgi:hypothetical protein